MSLLHYPNARQSKSLGQSLVCFGVTVVGLVALTVAMSWLMRFWN